MQRWLSISGPCNARNECIIDIRSGKEHTSSRWLCSHQEPRSCGYSAIDDRGRLTK
jgi:hypothetical protein